jgi:diadenosine tetraphosphatase ApaH/serine/threonine PP2A family protein phosphatase
VAQHVAPQEGGGFRRLARATRPLHWDVIDPPRMRYLTRLPVTRHLELDGKRYYLVHATPRDAMDEYLTDDAAGWTTRLKDVQADFVCVGHTHRPLRLELGDKLVLNPGSVGQPRDGDPRAAYAVIENGQVELRRVEYDIDAVLQQMRTTGMPPWVIELSAALLRSGGGMSKEQMDAIV